MHRHDRLKHYLGEFALSELHGPLLAEVRAHARSCPVCQEWLNVHLEIGVALSGAPHEESESHPNASDLVAFALGSQFAEQSDTAWLRSHLVDCAGCAEEVELCREAVRAANTADGVSESPMKDLDGEPGTQLVEHCQLSWRRDLGTTEGGLKRRTRHVWRGLWAAGIFLALLGVLLYVAMQRPMPEELVLTGETLRGTKLIEAAERVEVSQSRIDVGAKVTLRAAKVSLGNGFSLKEGASLVIEARPGSQLTQTNREEMQ